MCVWCVRACVDSSSRSNNSANCIVGILAMFNKGTVAYSKTCYMYIHMEVQKFDAILFISIPTTS